MEHKHKILLADDETNIRLLGEKLLTELGYEVILASNGQEAVQLAIQERPDLVITDIRMPKMTGFEVCKALRSDPILAGVTIIILSALGDEYNKLTGFEGGANDFLVKPFRTEELKERVSLLLERGAKKPQGTILSRKPAKPAAISTLTTTGIEPLDKVLGGGLPKGSNILIVGPLGKGKSTFSRKFITEGLTKNERSLLVSVDDDPVMVRQQIAKESSIIPDQQEKDNALRLVDAYSWSSGEARADEKFKIVGDFTLDQLSELILRAGSDMGQTIQQKNGGRRVIDSISSFFVNFDIAGVQRFLSQIGRTGVSFGGVTTLFVIEEGAVNEQSINNIKYIMDGVIEFGEDGGNKQLRIANMKWGQFDKDWISW
jgi:DNA-binding response OmpR family regulator